MNFKGFGFSFIDNKPEELLYISMERLIMSYKTKFEENKVKKESRNKTALKMKLYNF